MARLLAGFIALFGAVCTLIAASHIAIGPAAIPGGIVANTTMDSEDRFYATLFMGFGVALVWASRDLARRANVVRALLAVFFAGGLARIVSAVMVGLPSGLFIFLGSLELILPIILWLGLRRYTVR